MMRGLGSAAIGVVLLVMAAWAADPNVQSLFDQGNRYFQEERYREAIESYSDILDQGVESAEVYFNLGNAYYKVGEPARAILHYERAFRLRPRDQDIRDNLALANLHIVDRVEAPPRLFFWGWVDGIRDGMTAEEWGRWSVIGLWVALAVTTLAVFRRRGLFRRQIRYLAGILIVSWVLVFTTFLWKSYREGTVVEGIVMAEKVEVLSAPDETGTVLFDLHEGVKVKVVREVPGWSEVSLADPKKRGWLPAEVFEVI